MSDVNTNDSVAIHQDVIVEAMTEAIGIFDAARKNFAAGGFELIAARYDKYFMAMSAARDHFQNREFQEVLETLGLASSAMNYMGDKANAMDIVEPEDMQRTNHAFRRVSQVLEKYVGPQLDGRQ